MFLVSSALITCAIVLCFTCSQLFCFAFSGLLLSQQVTLIRVYRIEYRRLLRAQYVESPLELLFLEHVKVLSAPTSWTSTWPRSHSLVILLLIYSATRRKCSSLYDDTLGTFAPWNSLHSHDRPCERPCNDECASSTSY